MTARTSRKGWRRMKGYSLWCYDGNDVELLCAFMDKDKAYAARDELIQAAQADELYWFSYSVSSINIIQ